MAGSEPDHSSVGVLVTSNHDQGNALGFGLLLVGLLFGVLGILSLPLLGFVGFGAALLGFAQIRENAKSGKGSGAAVVAAGVILIVSIAALAVAALLMLLGL